MQGITLPGPDSQGITMPWLDSKHAHGGGATCPGQEQHHFETSSSSHLYMGEVDADSDGVGDGDLVGELVILTEGVEVLLLQSVEEGLLPQTLPQMGFYSRLPVAGSLARVLLSPTFSNRVRFVVAPPPLGRTAFQPRRALFLPQKFLRPSADFSNWLRPPRCSGRTRSRW